MRITNSITVGSFIRIVAGGGGSDESGLTAPYFEVSTTNDTILAQIGELNELDISISNIIWEAI